MTDYAPDRTTVVEGSEGIRVIRGGGNVAYDRRSGRPAPTDAPIKNA
jgi:hypothetical protein